jgi:hypothetical protein
VLSDGFQAITNPGDAPATIEAVSLADPHDLLLLAAYIIPIAGDELYGVRAGFPPAPGLDPGVRWSQRHTAVGASIPHSHGPHVSNLLLVVKPTASTGTAGGVWISYRVAGRGFRFQTPLQLTVVVGRDCPAG